MSVLHLITQKPHLLLEHADAYTDLIGQEIANAAKTWRYRLWVGAITILLFGSTVVLSGVSLMLWASTPSLLIHTPWLLWATPLTPLIFCLISAFMLNRHLQNRIFFDLQLQIKEDLALLRGITAAT